MPKYVVNGEIYNIPDDKVGAFESKYPNATVSYQTKDGRYDIPASKKSSFLSKFPDAVEYGLNNTAKTSDQPVQETTPRPYSADRFVQGKGKDTTVAGVPYNVWQGLKPESKQFYYKDYENRLKEEKAKADELWATNERNRLIKEGNQKEINRFTQNPFIRALEFAFTNNQNPEVQTSKMVIDKSKEVQKQIKADREKTGGFGDVVRGFKDNAGAIASFGIGEMESNLTLLNAAKKYEKGEPLSKPEKKLLDVAALEASVNQSTDPGTGYRIGSGAAETVGFMKDFAITPGMGIFGKAAVRRFGTIAAEKTIAQIAKNTALRVGGDVVGAMGMASTVHAPRVFGDAYNRNLGDITPDENGYVGRSEGDEPLKALAKAFGSTVVEDYSEMVGSYFNVLTKPIGKAAGKAAGKVADKIGLEKVHKLIADVPASEWAKTVTDIQNRGQFSGVLEEYGEELVGTALNAAIVGDSKFSDLVDPKQQAETFMSVGLISGLIGGVKLSGYRGPKREAQKRLNSSINEMESALGEVKATEIISKLQNADDTQKSVIIDSLDEEVKPLVKEYVARESYLHGLELAKIKRRAEGEVPAEQLELEDSYEEGLSSEPDNSFKVKLDESKSGVEKMAERFNVDPETLFTGLDSGDPLSLIGVAYENSKEDGDALLNYYNAKAAYDGMIDGVRDNIDSQIESQKKEIKRRTAEDGNIYDVTLKTSDDVHYNIVKGIPAFNEDGTIDYANSPDHVFLRDDKGEVRMEPKDNLFKLTSKQDSNSVLSELEERIRMSEAQKAADKIDGVRDFQIGETILVPTSDGPVNAVVNNVSEDGVEIQTESPIDGKSVMIMPKRELSDRLQQEFQKTEENTEIKEPEKVESTVEESSNLSEETPVIDSRPEEEIKQSVTYPRDKGGFIDYSQIEDYTIYANALKEEFGTDALDVVNENISDIQKKIKKAENRPSAIERVRAKKALQLELDKMNQVKKILNPITEDVKTDRDYIDWVLDNSDDINEVKAAYDASKEFNEELQPWQKELLGRKISPNSFKRFGDRNKISGTFAKGWLKKDGEDIDVLAQELSGFGREVSEGDIIDFMLSNPTNRVRTTNDIQLELNKKFSELATKEMGFPIGGPESSTGKLYLMNKDKENKISLMPAIKEDISSQEQSYLDGIPEEELSKLAKARDEEMFNRYSEVLDNGMTIEEMEELESELYGNRGSETEIVAPTAQEEATGSGGEELRSSVQGLSDSNDSGARGENTEPAQVGPSFVAPEFKGGDLFDYAEKVVKSKEIQDAEKEVNSSPTEAQKQAGNYKKGHVKIGPYDVTIENPKGSVRSGVDANGKEWSITMNNTYGYFKGTKGKDGDHIDVFIGDNPSPKTVYVVDQVNNDGSFDEHKVLWGFDNEQDARDAYLSNYEDGWQGLGSITGVSVEEFNKWVESSKRKTKPFSEYKSIPKKVNKVSFGLNADKYLHNQTNDKDVRVFDAEIEDNGNGTFTISSLNRIKSLDGVDDVVDIKGRIPLADAKNYKVIEKGRIKLNDNGIYEVVSPLKIELVSDSDVRFRDSDNEVSSFADKYGLDEKNVRLYAESMKSGKTGSAHRALHEIRRQVISNSMELDDPFSAKSFGALTKMFSPIKADLYERFGSVDQLTQEYVQRTMEERGIMEAAQKRIQEELDAENNRLKEFEVMTDNELDAEYIKSLDNNEGRARDIINESARRNGYVSTDGFRMSHRAPSFDEEGVDKNMVEIAQNKDDVMLSMEEQFKMNRTKEREESISSIKEALSAIKRGEKPTVTIYRAVPKKIKEGNVRNGDWITLSRSYAEMHGKGNIDGDYKIMEDKVPAENLYWDGNDINEWGYDDKNDYKYRNTKNNRKLNDLITRDDDGNIILPSKRFNFRSSDIRFRDDSSPSVSPQDEIRNTLQSLSEKMGVPVKMINSDEVSNDNKSMEKRMKNSKGWYDVSSGEVVIITSNATSVNDAKRTFLHEVVGHKGLRSLMGEEFDSFLDKVKKQLPADVSKDMKDNTDVEEYLARIAEMDETPSFFGKIKAVIREFLRKYMDVELSDNDVKYILWTSKNNLEKNSVFRNAANELMKDKMFSDENSVEAIIRNAKQDGTYMKAPNGKPTKLTEKQWAQVRTQEFKDWFGDWQNNPEEASKVVDENGEPLVVYHGTSKPLFYSFDPLKSNPVLSGGMYFSNSKDLSQKFSGSKGNLYSVFLSIKNPERNGFDGSGSDMSPSEYRDGGIFVKRKSDKYAVKGTREYIVFNPNQIKSATDNVGSFDPNNPDIRFRDGENYDDKFKGSLYKFQESYQDSMLGLKKLQESIEKDTGKIEDFENAYIHENQLSSKNAYEAEIYHTNFFTPIVKEMSKVLKVKSREEFNQYLISKHGLERNIVFAQRDARNEAKEDTKIERSNLEFALYKNLIDKEAYDAKMIELDEKESKAYETYLEEKLGTDYSGLSSLYKEDFENKAKAFVESFEADVNTSDLWDKINNATKETLRKTYTSGLMSKDNYDNIKEMFSYYVPLRGWKEDTAADVYDYIELDRPVFNAPIVTAKGRLSVSDDPIATIANMAESAILQGNRNLMKQKFLNMALNHKTPLLTVKEMWYVNNGTDKAPDWVESLPYIPEGATAEEVSEAVEAHYNLMRDLQKEGRAKKDKKGLNISYRANDREKRQHAVVVKRNGKEQVVFVNGNPRAAQAVNGLTNPDAVSHKLIEWIGWANRQLAANFTTRNPAFVLSNLLRDLIFSSSAVLIKEDGKYSKRFTSNLPRTTANIAGLMRRRYKGELKDFGMDKYFKEFLENGGETGYSMLTSVDEYKKLIEKDLLKLDGKVDIGRIIGLKPGKVTTPTTLGIVPAFKGLASFIEFSNKCAEDISRFNTYLTSREMGRSVTQSINDAKEVTVNFNKKGAGGNGATTLKALYLFFNAAVQSLNNFYRLGKNNPIKFSGVVGGFVSAGILIPLMNQMLMNMFGGDDDSYDNLPEWVRKNNFCLWLGGDRFLTIPLPIELRAFYGMGEMFTQWSGGKMKGENVGLKMLGQITDLLPLDPMGTGAAVPDAVKPIWQSYTNEDFFGKPIYKKTPFNEDMPEYTKAFKGTNKQLVESAEFLNEITGGDKYTKGSIDLNPSIAEHLVEGYLGGMGKTLNQTWKTISMIWDEDQRVMRNVPVANRFLSETDEKNAFSRVGKAYNNYRKEYDLTNQRLKGYEKEADKGVFEFAEKANSLYNSPEYKRYEVFKEYQKEIDYLYDELKTADGAEKASLNNTLNLTKTQLVEALDAIE